MLISDARWYDSTDIIVVGYGGAGAVAAITSHDLGADVLVVEKQPQDTHCTNTQMSGGIVIVPTDVESAARYMEALCQVEGELCWTDRDILHAWAEYASLNKVWIESLGGSLKLTGIGGEHRQMPGWQSIERWCFDGRGLGLHRLLTSQVARRGIRLFFNAPAQNLVTDFNGDVVGVRVTLEGGGHPVDIEARLAVIMTTGGFEFNETMKLNYLRVYPTYFTGTPANTGDGHRMVMELGADLWHMNSCSARLVAKFPDYPLAFSLDFGGRNWFRRQGRPEGLKPGERPAPYIVVDRAGRRFTSESFKGHTLYYELTPYDSHGLYYPRVPCFWVFDQERMEAGPLPGGLGGTPAIVRLYSWSKDNSAELAKGWIVRGETIAELADSLGLPEAQLTETVNTYNAYCHQGCDPQFNRPASELVPLCKPPFYALRLYPGGPNTQGGPRRNHLAQVLSVGGEPIRRLYAAGEFGSIYGMLYPAGGGNLAECIAFGRIAAENATRERPRS